MTINREHLAGLNYARSIIEENWPAEALLEIVDNCIAQAQAAPEAEPVAFMYSDISDTEEYLRLEPFVLIGGDLERHAARAVQGVRSVTPLYTAPQHDAELVELLRECQRLLSAEPRGILSGMASQASRAAWYEEMTPVRDRIDAKLATLKVKP